MKNGVKSKYMALLWVTAALTAAHAQDFPSKPIELVVAFSAGGGSDAVGRGLADSASRAMPQPMIVINKPGATGTIGFAEGANAKPDGYKVTMISPELLITQHLGIGKVSYRDFRPIGRFNEDPCTVAVQTKSQFTSLESFTAFAKANPSKINVANSGAGSIYHVCAAAIEEKLGLKFNHIPYLGSGPTINALMGDQVDAVVISPTEVNSFVQAGKVRLLAVMSKERAKGFENVPTFRERNIDLVMSTWRGLAVPKATPDDVVGKLGAMLVKINADPGYQAMLDKQFMGRMLENREDFAEFLKQDDERYKRLVPMLQITK